MKSARPGVLAIVLVATACGGVSVPARDINRPPTGVTTTDRASVPPGAPRAASVRVPRKVEPRPVKTVEARPVPQPQAQPRAVLRREAPVSFIGASAVYVGEGDTVYALSRRHRIPIQAIIRENDLKPPFVLKVGQRISLPRGRQHRVEAGQTLYSIAQSYDTDIYSVARLNGVEPPYTIRSGQILVLPDAASSQLATRGAAPLSPPQQVVRAVPTPPRPVQSPTQTQQPAAERMTRVASSGAGKIALIPPRKPPVPVSAPPARSAKGFSWPLQGRVISSFGSKDGGLRNDGINIRAASGAPVAAAENGVVAYAGNEIRGFGNLLLIKHAGGYITAYAHNDQLLVQRGQRVQRGQKIATVGATGSVNEPQLHFEVRRGRKPQDPKRYLPQIS